MNLLKRKRSVRSVRIVGDRSMDAVVVGGLDPNSGSTRASTSQRSCLEKLVPSLLASISSRMIYDIGRARKRKFTLSTLTAIVHGYRDEEDQRRDEETVELFCSACGLRSEETYLPPCDL
ncbi:hypothetical protein V1477_012080 [Vespula maculifrons]|uniref:Uncharacterized protein n=1 Tax=Vespula maculifrons TaxID=7453 RepID=A0ABD2BWI2_VESMC